MKFDPQRRMSDLHNHDFVIQKYGHSFDVNEPRVAISKTRDDSSEDFYEEGTVRPSTFKKSQPFSSQELSNGNTHSVDSTEKTKATSKRSVQILLYFIYS